MASSSVLETTMPRELKPESNPVADLKKFTADWRRRDQILEEDYLRHRVERHAALRDKDPILWRSLEQARLKRNRERSVLNRRLRAEGLQPLELEASFDQDVKKLQRLERQERAGTARRKARS